jgi:hypothetical protein
MNGPVVEIPQYRCHKVVRAAKITAIERDAVTLLTLGDIGGCVSVSYDFDVKNQPEVGGYYVVYADGYSSYSPAKAFEEGYSPVPQDFKGRVRQEYDELNEKLSKFVAFFGTPAYEALSADARSLLQSQHAAMCDYSNFLGKRIASF